MGILSLHSCLSQFLTINLILSVSPQASPIAQVVKNLPDVQETRVRPLGQEDPLEKEMAMAAHSSILACRRSPEEGNGSLLQYSWLENPRDGGA